jgi:primase-polymerase (primpol)-like protein
MSLQHTKRISKEEILTAKERPSTLKVHPKGIPVELRERDQWVPWGYERRDGRWSKIPIDVMTGSYARANDAGTWTSCAEAYEYMFEHGLPGIGYVFSADDPYTGIDLDDCIDIANARIDPEAKEIVRRFSTYCEISPSGTGLKLILRGELPGGGNRKGNIELYDRNRFFCLTGQPYIQLVGQRPGFSPRRIANRPRTLRRFHAELFPQKPISERAAPGLRMRLDHLADETLLANIRASAQAKKFKKLWRGDISAYRSHSEADLALCSILAFWTGADPTRVDRLFRASGLMRDKWNRRDYRQATINEACSGSCLSSGIHIRRTRPGHYQISIEMEV